MTRRPLRLFAPLAALAAVLLLPAAEAGAQDTKDCCAYSFCYSYGGPPNICITYVYTYSATNGEPNCDDVVSYTLISGDHAGTCDPCTPPPAAAQAGPGGDGTGKDETGPLKELFRPDVSRLTLSPSPSLSAKGIERLRVKSVTVEVTRSPELLLDGEDQSIPLALYTVTFFNPDPGGDRPEELVWKVGFEFDTEGFTEEELNALPHLPGASNGKALFDRTVSGDDKQYAARLRPASGKPEDAVFIRTRTNLYPDGAKIPGVDAVEKE